MRLEPTAAVEILMGLLHSVWNGGLSARHWELTKCWLVCCSSLGRNMFHTCTLVLSVVCVQCLIWQQKCCSLIVCIPGMLLRYCLSDFELVSVDPFITGITFYFTFHMCWISVIRSLYFRTFSASLLMIFLSPEIAASINMHVPFFIIRDYDVWFIVRNGSIGSHLLFTK